MATIEKRLLNEKLNYDYSGCSELKKTQSSKKQGFILILLSKCIH